MTGNAFVEYQSGPEIVRTDWDHLIAWFIPRGRREKSDIVSHFTLFDT